MQSTYTGVCLGPVFTNSLPTLNCCYLHINKTTFTCPATIKNKIKSLLYPTKSKLAMTRWFPENSFSISALNQFLFFQLSPSQLEQVFNTYKVIHQWHQRTWNHWPITPNQTHTCSSLCSTVVRRFARILLCWGQWTLRYLLEFTNYSLGFVTSDQLQAGGLKLRANLWQSSLSLLGEFHQARLTKQKWRKFSKSSFHLAVIKSLQYVRPILTNHLQRNPQKVLFF